MSPWLPEWYMINGGYTTPTASIPANYTIPFVSVIVTSPTEATIVAGSPTTTPGSYSGVASTEGNFSGFSAIDHRPFTNAVRCIKAIFPKVSPKVKEFEYINEVLQFLSNRYNLNPIDCEDSRACDVVRYFQEYLSFSLVLFMLER